PSGEDGLLQRAREPGLARPGGLAGGARRRARRAEAGGALPRRLAGRAARGPRAALPAFARPRRGRPPDPGPRGPSVRLLRGPGRQHARVHLRAAPSRVARGSEPVRRPPAAAVRASRASPGLTSPPAPGMEHVRFALPFQTVFYAPHYLAGALG